MRRKPPSMLCPYCLDDVVFGEQVEQRRNGFQRKYLACPECDEQVPRMYVADYRKFPPVVVSAVGFTQHGKSVYFSSLFYALRHMGLAVKWPGFYTQCLNDESLSRVWEGVRELKEGRLPEATAKVFPAPIMLRMGRFPGQSDCTLVMYDASGESFHRPSQLVQYARFVARASSVLFFVSLPRIHREGDAFDETLHRLLETYVAGVRELGARERQQRLTVVFTMADASGTLLGEQWESMRPLLLSVPGDERRSNYHWEMDRISRRLRRFTHEELEAHNFLTLARGFFREISYCIVSSLGTAPREDNTLATQVIPRRVFDPVLGVLRDTPRGSIRSLWRYAMG